MGRIYLISTETLKRGTTINGNVSDTLLCNAIYEGQQINIQQIIGTKLLRKIEILVDNGTITDPANSDYKTLLDEYLQPALIYWAWYYSVPYLAFKLVNKGAQRQTDENSNNASLDEIHYVEETIRDKAEFFSQRLADFLTANRSTYPEYHAAAKIDEMTPNHNQAFQGVQFDGFGYCSRFLGHPSNTITL